MELKVDVSEEVIELFRKADVQLWEDLLVEVEVKPLANLFKAIASDMYGFEEEYQDLVDEHLGEKTMEAFRELFKRRGRVRRK